MKALFQSGLSLLLRFISLAVLSIIRISAVMLLTVSCVFAAAAPALAAAAAAPEYRDLSPERQDLWRRLLHYSGQESSVNGDSDFFLSPAGFRDPEAEYQATVRLLAEESPLLCDYPARYFFITGEEVPEYCSGYRDYVNHVSFDEVFAVFATEMAESPVSSMGHLMIMTRGVNPLGVPQHYGIGFAAPAELGSWGLLRDFFTGSIAGRFLLNPYDDLIYTYVSKENRSLWEYKLSLTPEERAWLQRHVFELRAHAISYSFSSHNCASGVQEILTAAGSRFQGPGNSFYLTPLEYARHLSRNGLITEIGLRPSRSDTALLKQGRNWNPLERNLPFRISGGYLYREIGSSRSPSEKRGLSGGFLEITPVITDLRDDDRGSPGITESVFLRTRLEYLGERVYLRRLDLLSMGRIPDSRTGDALGTGFAISFRGERNLLHSSLYPEAKLGIGSGFGYGIINPYAAVSGRAAVTSGGPGAALDFAAGAVIRHQDLGRLRLGFDYYLTEGGGDWFGKRSSFAISWFRRLVRDWNAGFEFSRDFRKRGRPLNEFSGGLIWFF